MDKSEIQREIVAFVCQNFLVEESEFDVSSSLIDQGTIDSFGLVEISGFLRKKFGVAVAETDMNRNNFGSIVKMAAFVESKKLQS